MKVTYWLLDKRSLWHFENGAGNPVLVYTAKVEAVNNNNKIIYIFEMQFKVIHE